MKAKLSLLATLSLATLPAASDPMPGRAPHSANPILPGYYADPITFTADGRIETIEPSHQGPEIIQGRTESNATLVANATITSSSDASEFTEATSALDDNYATRWAPADDAEGAWLQLDLGSAQKIQRQLIRPEYAWKPYRFTIEASTDGKSWEEIGDHTEEAITGSPMISDKPVTARYLRLVFPEDAKGSEIGVFEWAVF